MSQLVIKKFAQPDERRPFVAHGHLDLIQFDGRSIGMAVFEPGWKWSKDVQPLAGDRVRRDNRTMAAIEGQVGSTGPEALGKSSFTSEKALMLPSGTEFTDCAVGMVGKGGSSGMS